jgi:riboflavin kinase / FMN adenylyltransferase
VFDSVARSKPIICSPTSLQLSKSVLTIGAFDGVHRGHQELIRRVVRLACELGVPSVVYTFDVPPKVFFGKADALIPLAEKLARISNLEPDYIVVAHFAQEYARRTAAEFIAELKGFNPDLVLLGGDFRFGSCKSGDVALLGRHFATRILPTVLCGRGEVVSSSRIRGLRRSGQVFAAAALEGWIGANPVHG